MMKRDLAVKSPDKLKSVLQARLERISEVSKDLHRQGDIRKRGAKALNDERQNLLRDIHRKLVSVATPKDSIFISYSALGKPLGELARKLADEYGLYAKTGFDAEVEMSDGDSERDESLPQAIMNHITSCDCFLGIWTDEFDAQSKEGVDMRGSKVESVKGGVPSVWMPFELGVAASHRIPLRLLVVKGMHRGYYEKPFHFQTQIVFEKHEFEQRARKVIEYLAKKVRARRGV